MTTIVDTIQAIVRNELLAHRSPELGVVEAVHPHRTDGDLDNYGCDVRLKNTDLLLKRVPVATGHIGTVAIPNVGDLVLVVFEGGEVNQPIITGRVYNDEDRPPLNTTDQVVFRLPLAEADDKSILGQVRNFPDERPPRELTFEMPPKITLRLDDGSVTATAGTTEVELDQGGASGGTVTIVAGRTKLVMNQDGDITVESMGSISLDAAGNLSLKAGGSVSIEAGTSLDAKGNTSATVQGGISASLKGGISAQVQGTTVSIKGITSFSP